MLIATEHQAIILPNTDPAAMLAVIPTSKTLRFEGRDLTVVPHALDETRVLRNMGIEAPSPIAYYYGWPKFKGIHEPFSHQRETAAFSTLYKRCYILNDMGTGKTDSALWAADYLMSLIEHARQVSTIRKVLVCSPLSTIQRVWGDAVFQTFGHRSFAVLHGTAERRRKKFAEDHDIYIVNHHGLEIICDVKWEMKKGKKRRITGAKFLRDDIDLVIIDELAVFRNAQTDLHRVLKYAIKPHHWVWGMTGTPTPEAPTDAYAQCKLVTPETVPDYFTTFRNMTMQQLGPYKWIPRKEATEVVFKAMQPAIRFKRDDCIDLPPCTSVERECELSPTQQHHFTDIMQRLFTEVEGSGIKAVNEGVKMIKLLQAACGVLYAEGEDGRKTIEIDPKPRIELLNEIIEEAGQKVIVFAPFTGVIQTLCGHLSKHWTCEKVYGGVSSAERSRIFGNFQSKPDPHVLIADAGCMAHGLTLTEANTIVWYAPIMSNDEYTQANARITRPGQVNHQYIVHMSATAFERRMYKRLMEKTKVQGVLLEMVEQGLKG